MAGIDKVLGLVGASYDDVAAVSHGTTVATNQLLEGKVDALGYITNTGYEAMLEIARQSVPDGYGNSYFWVKPPRIVPRHLVQGRRGPARLHRRASCAPSTRTAPARSRAGSATRASTRSGVCFLHAYANPDHEERMRAILREEHPDAVVSLSSEVLREYREYERAMTTLVDAAVKPRLSRYVNNIKAPPGLEQAGGSVPFYVMKSNGGVLSADEVVHQPITTVLSGPAAGALGAALIAKVAGFDKVLTSDGGGTSTDVSVVIDGEPTLTTEGSVGAYPSKIPMIDVVTVGAGGGSIAWLSPEGTLKVGPQSAGADPGPLCYAKGGTRGHHHRRARRPRPDPAAPAGRRDPARRRRRARRRRGAGQGPRADPGGVRDRRPRDLGVEPGQRAAPGHRQARPRRPRLHAHHVRRVRVAAAVPARGHPRPARRAGAARPRQRVRVRPAHRRREERLRADPRRAARPARGGRRAGGVRRAGGAGRRGAGQGGLRRRRARLPAHRRRALLRPGLRGAGRRCPRARSTRPPSTPSPSASTPSTGRSTATTSPATGDQQVEWVNLRVSGIGPIQRPEIRSSPEVS